MADSAVAAITNLLMHAALAGLLGAPEVGDGAFYNQVNLQHVCMRRVQENWTPGLQCEWRCLAAWGTHEPGMLGQFVVADLPGGGIHV